MSTSNYEEEKPWELRDDFKFAPEKPEGDPWMLLGEPLFARDEKFCKVLRDEVNNLLLFAGLFSAVITAFVVQTFQDLKPDPNSDIIGLLSQISIDLVNLNANNGTMHSSPAIQLPSTNFAPSDSAIRVNVVWFTSLIFSLSSVLVSIVALQWLRSHQTYSGVRPRDSLAILNMRSESLHKWQVASIIMSLPVLLEVSLLLFFVGLIDFLTSLGNKPVVIVVSVTIGLSVLFLFVTTILPTAQAILLRFSSKYPSHLLEKKIPPSQCPYKSPQSLAFHHAASFALRSMRMLRFCFQTLVVGLPALRKLSNPASVPKPRYKALLYHLSTVFTQDTWTDIDLAWLGVRDAAQHSADLSEPDMGDEFDQFSITERSLPLYDIVQSFQKATGADYTHVFGSALYHCFSELSYASVMTFALKRFRQHIFRADNTWNDVSQNVLERNRYFQSLIISGKREDLEDMHDGFRDAIKFMASRSSSDFIDFGPPQYLHVLLSNIHILHHQNLLLHLDNLTGNDRYSKTMSNHRKEIMIRLGKALYSRDIALRPGIISLPPYLKGKIFEQGLSNLYADSSTVSLSYQYNCMVSDFFEHAAKTPTSLLSPPYLSTHSDIPEFIENASWDMYRSLVAFSLPHTVSNDHIKVTNAFHKVVDGIIERLRQPIKLEKPEHKTSHYPFPVGSSPLYLLYCSGIYARRLCALIGLGNLATYKKLPDEVIDKMNVLLGEMASFKARISIESTSKDSDDFAKFLDLRFRGVDRYGGVYRFCPEWWSFLDAKAGQRNDNVARVRSTWFEDAFFDQLRRVASSTLAYASTLIPVQDTQHLNDGPDAALSIGRMGDTAGYTLQLVQVPTERIHPIADLFEERTGNPSVGTRSRDLTAEHMANDPKLENNLLQ